MHEDGAGVFEGDRLLSVLVALQDVVGRFSFFFHFFFLMGGGWGRGLGAITTRTSYSLTGFF